MDLEFVQYFVVNSELKMSPGKVATQVAHGATIVTVNVGHTYAFIKWYDGGKNQKKIILRGKQKDLERLITLDFYPVRDNGLTEIPAGSLTCVALPPMPKSEAQKYVKRLQLY